MGKALGLFNGLCALNFAVFAVISLMIGGDALTGYVSHGHYFLHGKGHFTEVSEAIYRYGWWHEMSVFLSVPLMFILNIAWKISIRPEPDIKQVSKSLER